MKSNTIFLAALTSLMISLPACAQDYDAVVSEKDGYQLQYRHVLAAVVIAMEQSPVELSDQQVEAVQNTVFEAFWNQPASTVSDLQNAWNSIQAKNESNKSNNDYQGNQFSNTGNTLQDQWDNLVRGKMLVYTHSGQVVGDVGGIATQAIEQYAFYANGTFESVMKSKGSGMGMDQWSIDDYMTGSWTIQGVDQNQAFITITVQGRSLPIQLSILSGQLYMVDKPVYIQQI